ncbi:heavy-metal-associated domain-containing protein [Candidatus Woesearchaeota archaeon]|nr:heavy-metal-associated domain-containing protein [Candidatus Woesearchaeota archaeon]
MKTVMRVEGTHCQSCKMLIEEICSEISGIKSCELDYKTGKMIIEHEGTVNWDKLKKEIEKVGTYKIKSWGEKK